MYCPARFLDGGTSLGFMVIFRHYNLWPLFKLRGRTGFLDPPASYLHSKLILLWPELIEKCFRFWQTQRRCVIVKRTVKKAMWLLHFNNHNKYEFYFFIHSTYLLATLLSAELMHCTVYSAFFDSLLPSATIVYKKVKWVFVLILKSQKV